MPKTRDQKQQIVSDFTAKAKKSKSMVFVNFNGLTVKDSYAFRKQCRDSGGEFAVAKKTLMKIAFKDVGLEIDPKSFSGDVGTVFGYEDEITPAKLVTAFSKDHEPMKTLGGVLENRFIEPAMVLSLSKLPSKKELLAKLVGSIQAPVSGFVNVLAGNLRGLVQVLKAVSEKKA